MSNGFFLLLLELTNSERTWGSFSEETCYCYRIIGLSSIRKLKIQGNFKHFPSRVSWQFQILISLTISRERKKKSILVYGWNFYVI
jgi:hypothetical protein